MLYYNKHRKNIIETIKNKELINSIQLNQSQKTIAVRRMNVSVKKKF